MNWGPREMCVGVCVCACSGVRAEGGDSSREKIMPKIKKAMKHVAMEH